MDQDQVEIALNKLLPNVLPEHVNDIAFDVRHTAPNEFTLYALFGVPDDYWESLDHINRAALLHDTKMKLKQKARNYIDINIVFDKDNTRMIKQSDFDR
jgi:hypothetical protein